MRLLWFLAGGMVGTGATASALLWAGGGAGEGAPGGGVGATRSDVAAVADRAWRLEQRANRLTAEACDLLAAVARLDAENRALRVRLDAARRGAVGLAGEVGAGDRIPAPAAPVPER